MVHPDMNAGLIYRYAPKDREVIQMGLGLFNLTRPTIGFLGEPGVPLDRRVTVHVITQFPLSSKFDLLPMAQYMEQGAYEELDLGANLRYILLEKYGLKRALQFGGHYRSADAGYPTRLDHDEWTRYKL